MADHAHNHTPTFRRCLEHLKAQGFDEEGAHRICYSVHAGGEGKGSRESAEIDAPVMGVSITENSSALAEPILSDLVEAAFADRTVDATARVIKNVVLVGPTSPTRKRSYPASTLREAIPLYEGAKIYLNHPRKREDETERDVRDLAGQVVKGTLRIDEAGKLRGDVRALKTPSGDVLLGIAESAADVAGMSHNVYGAEKKNSDGSGTIIEKITKVWSVDLVTEPGTTKGLHENADPAQVLETENMDPKLIAQLTLTALAAANPALVESIRAEAAKEVREKEVKPLQERADKAEAEAAKGKNARIIESVLAKKEFRGLPDVTKQGLRIALAREKDLTESKVQAAAEQAKEYILKVGGTLSESAKGGKKKTSVKESAAAIEPDDADDDDTDDDDDSDGLMESMAPMMGVSLDDDEKDDDED